MTLFRLLRLPNLLIVALVQYLLYFHLYIPAYEQHNLEPRLNAFEFGLLAIATLCTTACGYIINDLYDYETDLINRPEKVIVTKRLSVAFCVWLYVLLGFLGCFFSLYLAFSVGQVYLSGLYLLSFAGLFFYTKVLKKQALSGNLLVALFCAGVAGLVWLAELPTWERLKVLNLQRAIVIQSVIYWYAAFAFFSTLLREIIKDLEDESGDAASGYLTFPILAGRRAAKRLSTGISLVIIALFGILHVSNTPGFSRLFYGGAALGIIFPLIYALYLLQNAQLPAHYHRISTLIKVVMLSGVLLLLL